MDDELVALNELLYHVLFLLITQIIKYLGHGYKKRTSVKGRRRHKTSINEASSGEKTTEVEVIYNQLSSYWHNYYTMQRNIEISVYVLYV